MNLCVSSLTFSLLRRQVSVSHAGTWCWFDEKKKWKKKLIFRTWTPPSNISAIKKFHWMHWTYLLFFKFKWMAKLATTRYDFLYNFHSLEKTTTNLTIWCCLWSKCPTSNWCSRVGVSEIRPFWNQWNACTALSIKIKEKEESFEE